MPLKISIRLTPQVTTIIYHYMKKILLNKGKKKKKKNTKMERLDQNPYVKKTIHR